MSRRRVDVLAIVFEHHLHGKHYQIRTAGRTLRLYTNGVFHSQYNPWRPFRGHVWDLLALPILNFQGKHRPKVLLLGLGGGAAVHQILRLRPDARVTAVELDPMHIELAKRFFKLDGSRVNLVHEDAVAYVARARARYDLIVDDLFADSGCEPRLPNRAVAMTSSWMARLAERLGSSAQVVFNTEGGRARARLTQQLQQARLPMQSLFELQVDGYSNCVVCLTKDRLSRGQFKENLRRVESICRVGFDNCYRIIDRSKVLRSKLPP